MIRCRDPTIKIRDRVVVDALNLDVGDGELVLLTGASGSGKSIVLKALSGIVDVLYEGIRVEGRAEIDGLKPVEALRRRLSLYIPQDLEASFVSWTLTHELELLGVELREELRKELLSEDLVKRPLDELSAGEKYRILIALAISVGARALFIDEPSTFVDRPTLIRVLQLLRAIAREERLSVVIADHRVDVIKDFVDEVIHLDSTSCCSAAKVPQVCSSMKVLVEDVWYRYGLREPWVVRGASLDVVNGDLVALVGRNGVGKTTLLRLLLGVLKPRRGRIERSFHRAFYVPQNPVYWFTESSLVNEAKAVGAEPRAIKLAGLWSKRALAPHALSVGEARRLSIYLAAYSGRQLVVVDEPTLGLDLESWYCIKELFEEMSSAGIAVVIATHDIDFAKFVGARIVEIS